MSFGLCVCLSRFYTSLNAVVVSACVDVWIQFDFMRQELGAEVESCDLPRHAAQLVAAESGFMNR